MEQPPIWPEDVGDALQGCEVLIKALHIGFDASKAEELSTPQEKMMAIALHYGDTLAEQKGLLKKAYELVVFSPPNWPASHAWAIAGQWLQAVGLQSKTIKDAWRTTILLAMAHRIAQAWFESGNDDDWLQSMDSIITQSWPFMRV